MKYFNDAVSVRLIGVTQPIVDDIPDSEGLISYTARVSNPSNQHNFATAKGLLNYCMREGHWSVFEMADALMEIKAPRDISRQILRHRSFQFQEFSQRYAEVNNFCLREAREQDSKNRQNSNQFEDNSVQDWWEEEQLKILGQIESLYREALAKGIAKECARVILPEGNTMSSMYMKGSIRSWIHYCNLRGGNGTQKEHQVLIPLIKEELVSHFPTVTNFITC